MMRSIAIKLLAVLALLLGSLAGRGQNNMERDVELDKKYTPNQSSIFNNLNKKNIESGSRSSSDDITITNSIKFCPTMLFRQKIFFQYERELTDGFALNLGIGKAFGDDFIQRVFFGLQDNNEASLSPYSILNNSTFSGSTPTLYAGLKIYFTGTTFDGGYVEFAYRYEKMNYTLKPLIDGEYPVQGSNQASFKMNMLSFGFGYTGLTGKNDNITHDFYMSFGLKLFKYTELDAIQYVNSQGYADKGFLTSSNELSARLIPAISIGYCFGFGF